MNFSIDDSVALLERTPNTLRALLAALPSQWITADEGPETFTAFDNVGHMLHAERTDWIPRARIILAQQPNRTFTPFDRHAQFRESAGKSMDDLLTEFAAVRSQNIAELRAWNLSDTQLQLEGEHPAFGTVTLHQLLSTWVTHDLGHIAQIARVMAKRYREDVGPWREYLPILDR